MERLVSLLAVRRAAVHDFVPQLWTDVWLSHDHSCSLALREPLLAAAQRIFTVLVAITTALTALPRGRHGTVFCVGMRRRSQTRRSVVVIFLVACCAGVGLLAGFVVLASARCSAVEKVGGDATRHFGGLTQCATIVVDV